MRKWLLLTLLLLRPLPRFPFAGAVAAPLDSLQDIYKASTTPSAIEDCAGPQEREGVKAGGTAAAHLVLQTGEAATPSWCRWEGRFGHSKACPFTYTGRGLRTGSKVSVSFSHPPPSWSRCAGGQSKSTWGWVKASAVHRYRRSRGAAGQAQRVILLQVWVCWVGGLTVARPAWSASASATHCAARSACSASATHSPAGRGVKAVTPKSTYTGGG